MSSLATRADRELCAREASLIALRRQVHRRPELAFDEHATAAAVAERLEQSGLEVRRGVGGTGVVGVLVGGRPGRTVAWRADMDALPIAEPRTSELASTVPGVMHACGHDGHTALGVSVAEVLAGVRSELAGVVVFVFQPAEEVFGGAARMLAEGALDAPRAEEVYGLHLTTHLPPGEIAVGAGAMWAAADLFEVELVGRGAHGAYPHLGRNPIVGAAALVTALQGVVAAELAGDEAAVLSIGALHAGERANVVPERARLAGSMRTLSLASRDALRARVSELAAGVAAAHRLGVEVRWSQTCDSVRNEARCAALVARAAAEVLGPGAVRAGQPSLASDDVSVFLAARPGCYFRAGIGPAHGPPTPHHSPEFWMNEAGLLPAARVALRALLGSLTDSTTEYRRDHGTL